MLIHSRPITVGYHANRASCASCWSLCYILLLIVLPYVLAIAMGTFWAKDAFERVQPGVQFRHEVLVEAYLADGSAMGWSTSDQLNTALGARLRPCQLRAWPEDTDRDGKPEALQFLLTVPLDAAGGERLHGLTVLVGVEAVYSSAHFADLRLNGSVVVQHQSGLPGARWRQQADIGLRTTNPLRPASMDSRKPCGVPFWLLQQPLGLNGQPTTAEAASSALDAAIGTGRARHLGTCAFNLTLTPTPTLNPEKKPNPNHRHWPSSAPAPSQGRAGAALGGSRRLWAALGGSGRLWAGGLHLLASPSGKRLGLWAPSRCLGCSLAPPPKAARLHCRFHRHLPLEPPSRPSWTGTTRATTRSPSRRSRPCGRPASPHPSSST